MAGAAVVAVMLLAAAAAAARGAPVMAEFGANVPVAVQQAVARRLAS